MQRLLMDASDGRGEGLSVDIHSKGHQTNNIFRMKKTGRGGGRASWGPPKRHPNVLIRLY